MDNFSQKKPSELLEKESGLKWIRDFKYVGIHIEVEVVPEADKEPLLKEAEQLAREHWRTVRVMFKGEMIFIEPPKREDSDFIKEIEERYPKIEVAEKRECGEEVAELRKIMDSFEKDYPLEELLAITERPLEGSTQHRLRESAKEALMPIHDRFRVIQEETNIDGEQWQLLEEGRKKLSNAVGFVNHGKIRHE